MTTSITIKDEVPGEIGSNARPHTSDDKQFKFRGDPIYCLDRTTCSVSDAWKHVTHRTEWITKQLDSMEKSGPPERIVYSYIKATGLYAMMRAALSILDSISEFIPA